MKHGRKKLEERFEDVPVELSEQDRFGAVKINSYMDFFLNVRFMPDKDDMKQPAGMTANNRNYRNV